MSVLLKKVKNVELNSAIQPIQFFPENFSKTLDKREKM